MAICEDACETTTSAGRVAHDGAAATGTGSDRGGEDGAVTKCTVGGEVDGDVEEAEAADEVSETIPGLACCGKGAARVVVVWPLSGNGKRSDNW